MTEHVDELMLDVYVWNPEQLTESRRAGVRNHLETCEACRGLAEMLREFHGAMQRAQDPPPALMEVLVKHIAPAPNVIPFRPAEQQPPLSSSRPASGQSADRYVTILQFAGDPRAGTAVLQQNPTSDQFRFEYRPANVVPRPWGIVSLGDIVDAVLDDGYRAYFSVPRSAVPGAWGAINTVLRFPAATLRTALRPIAGGRTKWIEDSHQPVAVRLHPASEGLHVEFVSRSQGSPFTRASAVGSDGVARIFRLLNSACVLAPEQYPEEVVLNVYE